MGLLGWWSQVVAAIQKIAGNIASWAGGLLEALWSAVSSAAGYLYSVIRNIGLVLARLAHLITQLDWKGIWSYLKSLYDAFRRWSQRLYDIVFGPIRQIQAIILQIYNTFFRPIIQLIDTMRKLVQIIAIFDRKLAAQLDQFLLKVEAYVLAPITALLSRVNGISSYLTAIITRLGLLDRTLLIESIRRDTAIIWKVLLNPLGAGNSTGPPMTLPTVSSIDASVKQYAATQTGDLADGIATGQAALVDALVQIGVT